MNDVVILHDLGDLTGGDPWQRAFREVAPGDVVAPTLPGHGAGPDMLGGWFELIQGAVTLAAVAAERTDGFLGADQEAPPVLVGVGASGWAAQTLAMAGRVSHLVLVDGLGAPFLTVPELMAKRRHRLRNAVAPGAAADGVADALPGALAQRPMGHHDLDLARRGASAITVPTLVCESPASEAGDTASEITALFGQAQLQKISDASPSTVAAATAQWLTGEGPNGSRGS